VEIHTALTPDGYQLIMHRIPYSPSSPAPGPDGPSKRPVLLQHGVTDASAGWCLNSPQESLAYILADNGYDVWLGNNRGNGYSMSNIYYGCDTQQFWNFTWDEMATYYFPTMVKYVSNTTGYPKISYIGHSEGTTQAFAGLIENNTLAYKLSIFIALAPVAYVGNITVPLWKTLAFLDGGDVLTMILTTLGLKEFVIPQSIHAVLPDACNVPGACEYGSILLYGNNTYLNQSRLPNYFGYEPFPTSVKNMAHWLQSIRSGTFAKYDYGPLGNQYKYGQSTPPNYNLENFPTTVPLCLFTGGIDGLADPTDVQRLKNELPMNTTTCVVTVPNYGHLDPLLGYNATQQIYPILLQKLLGVQ